MRMAVLILKAFRVGPMRMAVRVAMIMSMVFVFYVGMVALIMLLFSSLLLIFLPIEKFHDTSWLSQALSDSLCVLRVKYC